MECGILHAMNVVSIRVWSLCFVVNLMLVCTSMLYARDVVVVGVNDLHSQVERVPAFAACLQEERNANPELLLVGTGDIFTDGESLSFVDRLQTVSELMNLLQMDALTLGNHEFDHGNEKLIELLDNGEFQVVCANCRIEGADKIKPYTILEREGLRIGIIGLVTTNESDFSNAELKNVEFAPAFEVIESFRELRSQCNILIVLSHLGYAGDLQLARLFPEADAIVGAHSHTVLPEGRLENGVLIVQAGYGLSHYSKLVFSVEAGKVIRKQGQAVPVAGEVEEPRFSQYVESARAHPIRILMRRAKLRMMGAPVLVMCLLSNMLAVCVDLLLSWCRRRAGSPISSPAGR